MRPSLTIAAGMLIGFIAVRMVLRHGEQHPTEQTLTSPIFEPQGHQAQARQPRQHLMSSSAGPRLETDQGTLASYIEKDAGGQDLDGRSHYRVVGPLDMSAAWWSITLYDRQHALIPNAGERYAFTSFNVIPENDGRFVIDVAPERPARVMNWLPCQRNSPFCLCIRLYRAGTHVTAPREERALLQIFRVNDGASAGAAPLPGK